MEKHTIVLTAFFALFITLTGFQSLRAQASMYVDNKAMGVGDILTVVLQEQISGSTSSDARNSSNAGAGGEGALSANFLPFQPTFGSDVEVNYDSDQQIATNQGQLLQGFMSVEVKEITAGGNLVIEGSRSTEINGELHKINLSGLVRPRDINGRNEVFSYRVGNARINYEKEEGLKRVTKKSGFIKRAVLTGVGIVVGAAAVMKAMN